MRHFNYPIASERVHAVAWQRLDRMHAGELAKSRQHTDLVCGMNLRFLEGVLDATPDAGLAAVLRPETGTCCVRLEPRAGHSGAG